MRELSTQTVTEHVARLFVEANTLLGDDVISRYRSCLASETSPTGRDVLSQLLDNADLARESGVPLCQDTGLAVVFLEIGQDLHIKGGDLGEAVHSGVRKGCSEGYLRASVVSPPLGKRVNTGDNTPAIIHTTIVPGERLRIVVAPKGGGSENTSAIRMLRPADGRDGVKRFVLETVAKAGANPCPPIVVGVGIGGTFELCALLAKKALLRRLGEPHPEPDFAALESELLEAINRLGTGPAGLGGNVTALAVHVQTHPCHIASLPVAVNINCHSHRHREVLL
ncbi:MAG: fumarate hydratase [Candidatus Methylomirabilia bacterium]